LIKRRICGNIVATIFRPPEKMFLTKKYAYWLIFKAGAGELPPFAL